MCGTSHWSTITSRYPSRARSNDRKWLNNLNNVVIPSRKLEGQDCYVDNIPQQFRQNEYRTAMIGKWHLSEVDYSQYMYKYATNLIKDCGFDRRHIKIANEILGPSKHTITEKSVKRKSKMPRESSSLSIPPSIINRYGNVTIGVDYF